MSAYIVIVAVNCKFMLLSTIIPGTTAWTVWRVPDGISSLLNPEGACCFVARATTACTTHVIPILELPFLLRLRVFGSRLNKNPIV